MPRKHQPVEYKGHELPVPAHSHKNPSPLNGEGRVKGENGPKMYAPGVVSKCTRPVTAPFCAFHAFAKRAGKRWLLPAEPFPAHSARRIPHSAFRTRILE